MIRQRVRASSARPHGGIARGGTGPFVCLGGKRFLGVVAAWLLLAAAGSPLAAGANSPSEGGAKKESFQYDPGSQRDPFTPLVRDGKVIGIKQAGPLDLTKPVLYGILWDPGGHSIALINDGEVKVGDQVGEYRVTAIREDSVVLVLVSGGEPLTLQITYDAAAEQPAP